MIRNIIFDWSGTLVDDLPAVWKATNYVLAQSERSEITLEQFRAEFSLPFARFYERHVPHVPMEQLEIWFHSRFRQVQESVCELPHALEFLKFCRARKIRTFVLSTVHRDHFQVQAKTTGFGEYLERAYLNVWDKREKIRELLTENGLEAKETLFIGDMQHDIETAKHGGVHSCAVLTGYNTLPQLRATGPDLIVEHLGELRETLELNHMEIILASNSKPDLSPVVTVGALIFNAKGEVLLVRTHKWSDLWGIPGGKIKWGESSEDALRRELQEETGLEVDSIRFVLYQDCIHSQEFYRDAHFVLLNYICQLAGPDDSPVVLNDEAREYRWLSLEQALEWPLNQPTRTLVLKVREELGR